MLSDLTGRAVLVTGGTRGIGLATGLAFARLGARCFLTYKWGSAEDSEVVEAFTREGLTPPRLVQSDVASADDIGDLLAQIQGAHPEGLHAFVSNVALCALVKGVEDYSARALAQSIDASVWPLVSISRRVREVFGRFPRYIVALSSNGPDAYHVNYDFVAANKAMLETLTRYLGYRLQRDGVRINVVRARFVKTESLWATCGSAFESFGARYPTPGLFVSPEEVARTVVALASGLMDGVSGQVLTVDRGSTFADNIMRYYEDREAFGLHSEVGQGEGE